MSGFKLLIAKAVFSLFLVTILAVAASAQSITGTISGTVTDPNGGVIPGATVTLVNDQVGNSRVATTNDEGRFTFAAVQPGRYVVRIEHQGFQKLLRENTVLSANENLALGELALATGNVDATVTVVGSGATVELETSDLTARLTSDQIDLISTKGRDITSLLRLIPGTTNENDVEGVGEGFGTDLPFISGQRGRSSVPTVDGLNAGEPSGSNKLSMTINIDAISEVKILRNNYAAEYGNNGGAIINIVSKGGGKNYKGSAYYFVRNEALNATPYFNNAAGLEKPLYRHNYWGFNFGGPMPIFNFGENDKMFTKNKAFFFFSYEKPRQISPTNPIFITVPTARERAGDFSQSLNNNNQLIVVSDPLTGQPFPNSIVPEERWNQSTAAFLRVFPLPNAPEGSISPSGSRYNFVTQRSVDVAKRSMVIRFDYKPTTKDSLFWKMQWWTSDNLGLGTSGWPGGDQNRWGLLSHYLYKDDGWSANWAHVFNSRMVNEFNFGMRHDSEGFIPHDGMLDLVSRDRLGYTAPQLFPVNNRLGNIPKVTNLTGTAGTPALINWLDRWGEIGNDYVEPSFADNFSYTWGNHSLKFGMYYERLLNGEAAGSLWAGQLSFTNSTNSGWNLAAGNTGHPYANALLGNFQQYQETQFRPHTNIAMQMLQWYGQDQWKVNRRLTLNYGVRFGWHTPFYQRDDIGSSFDPTLYDAANRQRFYFPVCAVALPSNGNACPTASRRVIDPANPGVQLTDLTLNRTYVLGSGNILNGVQLARDPDTPRGYRLYHTPLVEPRVGFAYDVTGNAKTVLRAMFGVYHTPRAGGGTTGDLTGNPPEQRQWTINNNNIANLEAVLAQTLARDLVNPWGSVRGLEKQTHTPEIYNFSVGVQHEIGWGTVIEASYVGSRGRWLGEQRDINQIPDGSRFVNCTLLTQIGSTVPCRSENRDPFTNLSSTNPTTGALNDDFLRPFLGYGDAVNFVTFSGTSRYDSLQVQVNRRYTKGFQYGIAYTWGKSTDYSSDDRETLFHGIGNTFGEREYERFNRAPSDFDQRHVFTINYIWDIPFFNKANGFVKAILGGWQISGTTSFATGKPKDVAVEYSSTTVNVSPGSPCPVGSIRGAVTGGNTPGLYPCVPITDFTGGSTNAFPFVVCDPNDFSGINSEGTPLAFNPDCFAKPTKLGDIGDPVRNLVRRPGIFNTDIAFYKNFRWGERRSIQLRWETYNVFNRANFSDIDTDLEYGLVRTSTRPVTLDDPCRAESGPAANSTNICAVGFGQTNDRFGAVFATRSPRVMQASIKINF
jgi:hypothetical protein